MSPEEKKRFKKDALLHKLQDERESILYKFIDYYTQDELERLDMRFVADKYIDEEKLFSPHFGGILKTKKIGLSDAYFFLSRKKFFDDYDVDWRYGDSNHGATIKCLVNDLKYLHLGPYFDNPNFDAMKQKYYNTYYYDSVEFLSHLKGGFSESKLSDVQINNTSHFLKAINDRI